MRVYSVILQKKNKPGRFELNGWVLSCETLNRETTRKTKKIIHIQTTVHGRDRETILRLKRTHTTAGD